MYGRKEFSVADGLAVQAEHMAFYKKALKPEVYEQLKAKVDEKNAKGYKSGYDVCRGTDIDNLFANIFRN